MTQNPNAAGYWRYPPRVNLPWSYVLDDEYWSVMWGPYWAYYPRLYGYNGTAQNTYHARF